jgi:hypothetical protein
MWIADAATAVLPTDSTTALDVSFKSVGLVTTDGATIGTAISSNDVPSFGSYSPSRTIITSEIQTVRFVAQETNKVTQAIKTRQALSAVTVTTGAMATTRGAARDALYAIVVDAIDTLATNHKRKVYPSVRLTALGDEQIGFAAASEYDFTFTAYHDASGNTEYEYVKITGLT